MTEVMKIKWLVNKFVKEELKMKLFHTENGKEKVYVQMQDIM